MHEAQMHDDNCFITLTFNDEHLENNRSLEVADFQKFMKRLRKFFEWHHPIQDQKTKTYSYEKLKVKKKHLIRFFHCGEYGAKFSRPHHHACLFGVDFADKIVYKENNGNPIYVSPTLDKLWSVDGKSLGFSTIGAVTLESAAYVARYVMKKWAKENLEGQELYDAMMALSNDELKLLHYGDRHEEYVTMSRRPGIGQAWFDKYKNDIFPSGFVVLDGKKLKIPKYYDSQYELDNVFDMYMIKANRIKRSIENPNNSASRLRVKELIKLENVKQLKRGYEYDS